ncbi:hypothetical protein ACVWZV_009633 [Bradyrhizobium sp. GM5.1]
MKKCIFCNVIGGGEKARSRAREHIFASWVLREFGIQKDEISYSRFESEAGATTTLQLTEQTRFRSHSFDSFLLGSVCNVCNNERLNALEGEVARTLKSLIPDLSASIPSSRCAAFALWGLKTAFVLTSFLDPPVGKVPLRHGRHVIGRQARLPRGVAVFHRQSPHWRMFFSVANSWVVEVPENVRPDIRQYQSAYKCVYQIGHAQFMVQFYPVEGAVVRYDSGYCELVGANVAAQAGFPPVPENIIDNDLFLFALSNAIALDGKMLQKVGPNSLCPCGSSIKYKRCHGAPAERRLVHEPQGWLNENTTTFSPIRRGGK